MGICPGLRTCDDELDDGENGEMKPQTASYCAAFLLLGRVPFVLGQMGISHPAHAVSDLLDFPPYWFSNLGREGTKLWA